MKKLIDVIHLLGDKNYSLIEFRCKFFVDGIERDEYIGACSYDSAREELEPLDNDYYSLYEECENWEEWTKGDDELCLTVWERAI